MTQRALVIRHVHFEDLGVLEPVLLERGFEIAYVDPTIEQLRPDDFVSPALLVVLGGPVSVYDLGNYPSLHIEVEGVRRRLARKLPTLGICLGAQVMAMAAGADVSPTGRSEIGIAAVELSPAGSRSPLAELGGQPVLHWHGDAFTIPEGSSSLASTPGFPSQAFAIGRHALALQFHLEVDLSRLEQWLMGHAHELASARVDIPALRRAAECHHDPLRAAAERVVHRWLNELREEGD